MLIWGLFFQKQKRHFSKERWPAGGWQRLPAWAASDQTQGIPIACRSHYSTNVRICQVLFSSCWKATRRRIVRRSRLLGLETVPAFEQFFEVLGEASGRATVDDVVVEAEGDREKLARLDLASY